MIQGNLMNRGAPVAPGIARPPGVLPGTTNPSFGPPIIPPTSQASFSGI